MLRYFHLERQTTSPASLYFGIIRDRLFQGAIAEHTQLLSLRKLDWSTALHKIGRLCPDLEVLKKITGRHPLSLALQEEAWPVDLAGVRLIFPPLRLLKSCSLRENFQCSCLLGVRHGIDFGTIILVWSGNLDDEW